VLGGKAPRGPALLMVLRFHFDGIIASASASSIIPRRSLAS
jgi:hypothetical protein